MSSVQTLNGKVLTANGAALLASSGGGGAVNLQTKSVTPTESAQVITADAGYDGLDEVDVAAISSSYVGSGIDRNDSTDLTASGATVTAPAGYYTSSASKSVDSMTLPTSTDASATSGYTSKATVSRSTSDQYINIPTGYNSAGGYYKVNAVANMTLPTSASSTSSGTSKATIGRSTSNQYINIPTGYNDTASYYTVSAVANGSATGPSSLSASSATVSTGTNTLTLTKTGVATTPTVSAGYVSSATASTATVALTASVTTKAAATINTSTSDQTIASGTYLTGAQTIKAVKVSSTLTAENIKNGVTIEVGDANDSDRITSVTGTYEGSGGGGVSIATATKTLTSAASSIQFTNLQGEPTSFAVVSAANLATGASPYKAASVVFDGTNVIGQYITNTSNAQMTYSSSAYSKSYSGGTLTVTCSGANFQANEYTLLYTYNGSSANIGTADVQVGSGATSITFTNLPDEPSCWSCLFTDDIGTSSGYTRALVVVNDGTSIYGMEMGSGATASSHWTASYSNGSLTISSQSTSSGGYFHQPGYYHLTYCIGGTVDVEIEPLTVTANGTYAESGKAYSPVVVSVSGGGGASIATETMTNSSNQNTSIDFTLPSGRTPKAFFARLTSQIARNSSSRYYYVFDMRWDGSSTGGVAGNQFYMYNGTLSNVTSGYSYSQSGTTFTLSSTGSRSAAPGSFYNGTYELVYVY